MGNLARLLTLTVLTLTAWGQGQVQLNNRITPLIDARFVHPDGTGLIGDAYTAELVFVNNGAMIPLVPSTVFRSTPAAAAGYLVPVDVIVPGVFGGEQATFLLRAYETIAGSYENAIRTGAYHGESNPVIVTLGGKRADGGPASPGGALIGLGWAAPGSDPVDWRTSENRPPAGTVSSMQVVPEPSTLAFALLGLAALLPLHRRVKTATLR